MQDWIFGGAILTWTYMAAQANGARLLRLVDNMSAILSQMLGHVF